MCNANVTFDLDSVSFYNLSANPVEMLMRWLVFSNRAWSRRRIAGALSKAVRTGDVGPSMSRRDCPGTCSAGIATEIGFLRAEDRIAFVGQGDMASTNRDAGMDSLFGAPSGFRLSSFLARARGKNSGEPG